MRFCKNCVTPSTRPDLDLGPDGICDACITAEAKHGRGTHPIDWAKREKDFAELVEKSRGTSKSGYDCIIPVSGGKDSTWQVHVAKNVYGLRPLCLCFEPTLPTPVGRANLENLNRLGVDLLHIKQNPLIYERMIMEGFKRVGDMEWANHVGIWTLPFRFAVAFDIPLIIWGEGRMEFAGNFWIGEKNQREMDEDFINDLACLNGLRAEDMVGPDTGIGLGDISMYTMPTREQLARVSGNKGCTAVFLGFFFNWDSRAQVEYIEKNLNWVRRVDRVETTYNDFEKLDCLSMNLHDYVKYCKFGYGRAADDASRDVRHGYIGREEAVRLVERWDGRYPQASVAAFCDKFKISREEFDSICDGFTSRAIFETKDGKFVRDIDRSLVMKKQWVEGRRNP